MQFEDIPRGASLIISVISVFITAVLVLWAKRRGILYGAIVGSIGSLVAFAILLGLNLIIASAGHSRTLFVVSDFSFVCPVLVSIAAGYLIEKRPSFNKR